MKKLVAIITVTALILSLAACAAPAEPSPSESVVPSENPSAAPSAKPSTEPSAEPSASPDDIDAYWEGRTLTSSSGDLVIDAARWVRDYYRSLFASVSPYESHYINLAAARISELRDDGFSLYTECSFLNHSGGEKLIDEYAVEHKDNPNWHLRSACFRFEAVDGGYRYVGISAPGENTLDYTMNTTVLRDGEICAGLENDLWQLETLVGMLANGETLDAMPSDAEYTGSLNYAYADTNAEWDFYSYTRVVDEWSRYTSTAAQCAATGEIVDIGAQPYMYLDMPTAQGLADTVDKCANEPFMLSRMDGYYFTTPEETRDLLGALKTALLDANVRLYSEVRDSMLFSGTGLGLNRAGLYFEDGWENPGSLLQLGISFGDSRRYALVVDSAENVYTEAQNFMQNKLDTLRDGTLLSEVEGWEPVTMTDEIQLLNRAYSLFGIYDMDTIVSNVGATEGEPIIKDMIYYYDLTPLCDPDSDGYFAHLGSYADFVAYTHSLFCDELATRLLNNGLYFEGANGELYGGGFGRGGMNPSIGATRAYYKYEPAEGVMVVRKIHERYTTHDNWQTEEYVGEGAWDTVFVKEEGAWKVKYISFDV